MARFPARSLLITAAALALAGGCTAPVAAQGHAEAPRGAPVAPAAAAPAATPATGTPSARPDPAPTRLWPFKRIFNADYVDVRDIARRYGLRAVWATSGRAMNLVDARGRVRLRFVDRDRDFLFDGVRIFMGDTTVFSRDSLCVGRIDVIKTIAPLLRPADYAGQLPAPPRLIVLDPGHGGNDPGNQNASLHLDEKAMTLDVARRLGRLLEARGYRVLFTRSDDRRVELEQRPEIAGRARADLFLSIHFNALPSASAARVSGTETYVLTPQFQPSTQPEKDKTMIPVAFPGNRDDTVNALLGYHLHRRLLAELKSSDRGFKRARWVVLRFAECPAALIEAAFLSNNVEARRVGTADFREQIAAAIADGVDDYAAALTALRTPAGPAPAGAPPAGR